MSERGKQVLKRAREYDEARKQGMNTASKKRTDEIYERALDTVEKLVSENTGRDNVELSSYDEFAEKRLLEDGFRLYITEDGDRLFCWSTK